MSTNPETAVSSQAKPTDQTDSQTLSADQTESADQTGSATDTELDKTELDKTELDKTELDKTELDKTEPAVDTAPADKTEPSRPRHHRLVPTVLAAVVLGCAVAVTLMAWRALDDADAQRERDAALQAARTDVAQLLSYDSKTLDADLARSRKLVSGGFAAKFEELATGVIVPASRQQSLTTKAEVVRAALIEPGAETRTDQVQALAFVNQTTTVAGEPQPRRAINQVKVTMTKVNNDWLISDLQPL
jgi:Mce-associated membrane protein